ncbi:hypothetical protein ABPG72_002723 [Tetrahymena utriculariae]
MRLSQQSYYQPKFIQIKNKILTGLPNLRGICYINSAIQNLRQLYEIDQTIFGSSYEANKLKVLFEDLNQGMCDQAILDEIVKNSKQNQYDINGGDAFMCINNFLEMINQALQSNEQIEEFNNNFLLQYTDHLLCKNCSKIVKNNQDIITSYEQQAYGQECEELAEAFTLKGDQDLFKYANPENMVCNQCNLRQFKCNREYKKAPNFMMVRLLSPRRNCNLSDGFHKQEFELQVQEIFEKYQIIGFCDYKNYHYKYIANYDDSWVEFNDNFVTNVKQYQQYNPIYFVLKKISNNKKNIQNPNKNIQNTQTHQEKQDNSFSYQKNNKGTNQNSQIQKNIAQNIDFKDKDIASFVNICVQLSHTSIKEYMYPQML